MQLEQTVFDLEQQETEELNQLKINLSGYFNQLQTQIINWEQNYLLVSPQDGIVSFTTYWQKNQNVSAGDIIVTVVPKQTSKIVGKILLPPQGAGKVKKGQWVLVKFDHFPYMEFGMVKVKINQISLVPIQQGNQKMYLLEVVFPEELITTYGKNWFSVKKCREMQKL